MVDNNKPNHPGPPTTPPPVTPPPGASDLVSEHEYDPPKDFHLAKPGTRDYVAGQPVDDAELKKVEDEHAKQREEAKKAAEEAKKHSEEAHKGAGAPAPHSPPQQQPPQQPPKR